jgi:hypothetical protein
LKYYVTMEFSSANPSIHLLKNHLPNFSCQKYLVYKDSSENNHHLFLVLKKTLCY